MKGTLILAILSVKSSYRRDIEEPIPGLDDVPDSIQCWVGESQIWHMRTHSLDRIIHVECGGDSRQDSGAVAKSDMTMHYGDLIAAEYVVEFADCWDQNIVSEALAAAGLEVDSFTFSPEKFGVWLPGRCKYTTVGPTAHPPQSSLRESP